MTRETSLERAMREVLDLRRLPFLRQVKELPGTPDFVIYTGFGKHVAVFVDGTYWHSAPSAVRRDRWVGRQLRRLGYGVVRVRGADRTLFRTPNQILASIRRAQR